MAGNSLKHISIQYPQSPQRTSKVHMVIICREVLARKVVEILVGSSYSFDSVDKWSPGANYNFTGVVMFLLTKYQGGSHRGIDGGFQKFWNREN